MRPIWTAPSGPDSSRSPLYRSSPSQVSSGPQKISSGSQMSSRPKPKPNVLNPIDSMATLPAKTNRSAQEIFRPYFCLIGHSNRRALSRLAFSGQLLRGAKRCAPLPPPPRPAGETGVAPAWPGRAKEGGPLMAVVGRPPVLRARHQLDEVLLQRLEVERLELFRVVEVLAHRIGLG